MTTSNPPLETQSSHPLFSNPITRAYGAILIALIVLSFAAVIIRLAQEEGMSSLMIAGLRLSGAAVILTPLVLYRYRSELRRLTRLEIGLAATAGIFLAIHMTFMALSLEYTSVLVAQVAVNTGPLWVAVLEMTFLKARLGRIVWIGLLIAVLGSLVVGIGGVLLDSSDENSVDQAALVETQAAADQTPEFGTKPVLGTVIGIIGAVFVGVYFTVGRKARATVPLIPYVWMVYGFGGVTGILIALFTGTPLTGYSINAYGYVLLLALLPQLVGHSMYNYAMGFLPATLVTISGQAISITAALFAFIMFAEVPSIFDVIGSIIIAGGVTLAIIGQSSQKLA